MKAWRRYTGPTISHRVKISTVDYLLLLPRRGFVVLIRTHARFLRDEFLIEHTKARCPRSSKPRPSCHSRTYAEDACVKMSLLRSRKIAPESPVAIEEGGLHDGERGLGEGCSRESISLQDDQTPLVYNAENDAGAAANSGESSAAGQQREMETRPESRIGRRFMRYRNSWVGEDCTLGTLRRVHARLDAARSRIAEETDEGRVLLLAISKSVSMVTSAHVSKLC